MHSFFEIIFVVFVYDLLALHTEKGPEMALSDVVKIAIFLLKSLVEDFWSEV